MVVVGSWWFTAEVIIQNFGHAIVNSPAVGGMWAINAANALLELRGGFIGQFTLIHVLCANTDGVMLLVFFCHTPIQRVIR